MSTIAKVIQIVARPHGDAPGWVRDGWIGCVLPCAGFECGHIPEYSESVIPANRKGLMTAAEFRERSSDEKIAGYSVYIDIALRVLECHSLQAADWFYAFGYRKRNGLFRFKREHVNVLASYTEAELTEHGPLHRYDDIETGTMRPMS